MEEVPPHTVMLVSRVASTFAVMLTSSALMFDQFLQDLRHGLHVLRRNPGFTGAAVLMLALGIGANTAIFSVVDSVVARSSAFQNPDRTVSISEMKRDAPGVTDLVWDGRFGLHASLMSNFKWQR